MPEAMTSVSGRYDVGRIAANPDHPADELLADCYRNALRLTGEHRIDAIAFPAISTCAFGYPFRPATEVACKTICDTLPFTTCQQDMSL